MCPPPPVVFFLGEAVCYSSALIMHLCLTIIHVYILYNSDCLCVSDYTKENNYLYAIPLKAIYTDRIKVGTKSSLNHYSIPYTKGAHLFCCAPLDSQFLRIAVAVKTKILMIAYKHLANMTVNGSPMTPTISANPLDNFIKTRVNPYN